MSDYNFYEDFSQQTPSPDSNRKMLSRKDRLELEKYENYIEGSISYIGKYFSEKGSEEKILKPTPSFQRGIQRNSEKSKAKKMIDACEISNDAILKWRSIRQLLTTNLAHTSEWKAKEKAERELKTRLEIQHREKLEKQLEMDRYRLMDKLRNRVENKLGEFLSEEKNTEAEDAEMYKREFTFQRPMQLVPLIDIKGGKLELTDDIKEKFARLQSKPEFEKPCQRIMKLTEAFVDEINL